MLLCLFPLLSSPGEALAQSTPADVVQEQNTIIDRFSPPPVSGSVNLDVVPQIDRIPAELLARGSIVLKSVRIEGATLFPAGAFAPLWADLVGQQIPVSALLDLTDKIEKMYRQAGIFAAAEIPAQDLADGVVRIVVYDQSFIETVETKGDYPGIRQRVAPYIDRLVALRPLRVRQVERILLLMSDLAGMNIDATLRRPDMPGAGGSAVLDIAFEQRSLRLSVDNRGTKEIGPIQAFASFQENDLFGLFESNTLAFATVPDSPYELLLGQIGQEVPIGWYGLHAGYQVGVTNSQPGGELKDFDLNVFAVSSEIYAAYPVLRTINHNISIRTGMTTRNNKLDLGPDTLNNDRYRWLTFGVDTDNDIGIGPLGLRTEFLQGISVFNATEEGERLASRALAETDFQLVTGGLDLKVDLFGGLSLLGQGFGQLAFGPLPSAVQISFGGDPFGRAFESAAASGDSGVAGSLELALDTDIDIELVHQSAAYTFIDYGVVGLRGSDAPEGNTSLGSSGVGFRAVIGPGFAVDATLAFPIETDAAVDDAGTQVYFSVRKKF